ncbi:O-antigen ligase family protein [Hamadaea tsunoensis]|uniref:O-antigen ligase family protein n=1 Tax=Hamadaea tsunoensis TaxID=53368 RepID=UPI000408F597|nr:O-antigen ligase family protein [Hamadaea tsunoensis]
MREASVVKDPGVPPGSFFDLAYRHEPADDYVRLKWSPSGKRRWVRPRGSRQASWLLQAYVVAMFVLPTDAAIQVIGAQGYAAALVAMLMFAAWLITALFGLHDPIHSRYPVRGALAFLWVASLISYVAMPFFGPSPTQRLSADRWLMLLIAASGIILVAGEHLRAPRDILRVVRAFVYGAAFSGFVAVLQFFAHFDIKPYLRMVLIGFNSGGADISLTPRDALLRVSGTANHPIEFGVTAAMVLPLAIWLGFFDRERSLVKRWAPAGLIGVCLALSVSRSAILTVLISIGLMVALLPARFRVWILGVAPFAAVGVMAVTPGYLKTMVSFTSMGGDDPSITNRTNNYPRVAALVSESPYFGHGGGTFLPADATKILDNQYLKTSIELGLVGVFALILYFLVPAISALIARASHKDDAFRGLCAALAGGCLAAAVGCTAFDGFSFPQFTSAHALMLGLCGAVWLYAQRARLSDSQVAGASPAGASSAGPAVIETRILVPAGGPEIVGKPSNLSSLRKETSL